MGASLHHLVGLGDEVLAQDRQRGRLSHRVEVIERTSEPRAMCQHRDGRRATAFVGRREVRGLVVGYEHAHARRALLDLGDHRKSVDAQRAGEVARLVPGRKALDLGKGRDLTPLLHLVC